VVLRWSGALPPDAVFKGYESRVLQELKLTPCNQLYFREKWYSPSLRRTFLAPWPEPLARYFGCQPTGAVPEVGGTGTSRVRSVGSQFGPGVVAFAQLLHYGANVGQQLVRRILLSLGIEISTGHVSNLLVHGLSDFHTEHQELERAGLRASPWVQVDVTSTRVNGVLHGCHVLTHPLFTSFRTLARQDRAAVVELLRGERPAAYRLDAVAQEILEGTGVRETLRARLAQFPQEVVLNAVDFARLLERELPRLGAETRRKIETAAQIAAYRADPEGPVIRCLLADDAPVFRWITEELALCWVHDARHYQKLNPQFELYRRQWRRFKQRYWKYYRKLLAYRQAPEPRQAQALRAEFTRLFATRTGYAELDTCIARTEANAAALLRVLEHPELPLHNNAAELAARQRVRRRDVSFGPRTEAGRKAWDSFQSLVATTEQLGIRFWDYLWDRITRAEQVPRLQDVIAAKANALPLGASWEEPLRAAA
jgi:hypothetical protein